MKDEQEVVAGTLGRGVSEAESEPREPVPRGCREPEGGGGAGSEPQLEAVLSQVKSLGFVLRTVGVKEEA